MKKVFFALMLMMAVIVVNAQGTNVPSKKTHQTTTATEKKAVAQSARPAATPVEKSANMTAKTAAAKPAAKPAGKSIHKKAVKPVSKKK